MTGVTFAPTPSSLCFSILFTMYFEFLIAVQSFYRLEWRHGYVWFLKGSSQSGLASVLIKLDFLHCQCALQHWFAGQSQKEELSSDCLRDFELKNVAL